MIQKFLKVWVINLLAVLFLSGIVYAGSGSGQISATSTAATTRAGGSHMVIVNQGSNEVFLTVATDAAPGAAATTSFRLDPNEGVGLDTESPHQFTTIGTITSASETTTVMYMYWD